MNDETVTTDIMLAYAANFDLKLCEDSRTLYSETSCGSCLFETCYVCHSYDKQYNNICRFCPPDDDLCAENLGCNEGYYLDFGVCFKCPIGCATCNAANECTDCDAGNYLRTLENGDIICDCEDGWFGTTIGDMLSCIQCDSICQTCKDTSMTCSTCFNGKFLHESNCVINC